MPVKGWAELLCISRFAGPAGPRGLVLDDDTPALLIVDRGLGIGGRGDLQQSGIQVSKL